MDTIQNDKYIPELPCNFQEMKTIAEKLSSPFPFVRVDLYNIKGRIYFGELTFIPYGEINLKNYSNLVSSIKLTDIEENT